MLQRSVLVYRLAVVQFVFFSLAFVKYMLNWMPLDVFVYIVSVINK